MSGMGDLYVGEYPIDMTVAEAKAELTDREQKSRMTAPESVAEAREVDLWFAVNREWSKPNNAFGMDYNTAVSRILERLESLGYSEGTPVPTAAHYAALKEVAQAIDDMWSECDGERVNPNQARSGQVRKIWTDLRAALEQPK